MQTDHWENGNPYEFFMGRWSRLVAHKFLDWLAVPKDQRWLDVGCGTGGLSSSILNFASPQSVLAIDSSDAFIAFAQQTYQDPRLNLQIADARQLPADVGSFDAAVSGLMLNFIPTPSVALAEMVRVTRPQGTVAIYVWDYADKMEMLRYFWDAAVTVDSAAKDLDEGPRFPLCQPLALETLFREAGLKNIKVRSIDVPTVFQDFNDYWSPFLGGQGPAPSYVMALNDKHRSALEKQLHTTLPITNGVIALTARAWAIRGDV